MKTEFDCMTELQAIIFFMIAHIILAITNNTELCAMFNFIILIYFITKADMLKRKLLNK